MPTIAEKPLMFEPHACAVTGRNDGVIVDMEIHTQGFEQRLYLKSDVIENAAKLLGMVPEREVEALRSRLRELEAESVELHNGLDALTKAKQVIEEVAA